MATYLKLFVFCICTDSIMYLYVYLQPAYLNNMWKFSHQLLYIPYTKVLEADRISVRFTIHLMEYI